MSKMRKAATIGLSAALAAGSSIGMVMPALAAGGNGNDYTPVAGTSTTFEKYLIMDEGDQVPNVTFSFTVAPGQAVSADTSDNDVMQVLPGVGTPTIADVTFADGDTTKLASAASTEIDVQRAASTRANGLTADTGVELEAGEKYAQHTATVSFAGITFPEPGIYRYVVTETASAAHEAAGIMHDNDVDRILDVYVTDDGTGNLAVSSYVLHTTASEPEINETMGSADVAAAGAALADKTDGFTNEYNSKDLKFTKAVAGNQASRDKYFEFTVTVSDVNDDDIYTVSLADDSNANTNDGFASATTSANEATRASNQNKTNDVQVTGAQLKAGHKFYLQHGQSIVIRGIAPNATYTVVEDAEDYQQAKTHDTGVIGTIAGTDKIAQADFTNTRAGIIPTGVLMTVIPGAVVVLGGGAGLFAMKMRGRRKEEDAE